MKILLVGEYSNVHHTLAEGLKQLGHQVTVVSNGDFWKDYPRDIDVKREKGTWGKIKFFLRLCHALPQMRNFDVVQLINPMFLELKANKLKYIYRYLRRHNGKMFLCAFGMDYYWVNECCEKKPLDYSDFNIGDQLRDNIEAQREKEDWIGTDKEYLNKFVAEDCNGIICGLYEYWVCYHPCFPEKSTYIPFPIKTASSSTPTNFKEEQTKDHSVVKVLIGIQKQRSAYKGTDIMLKAAEALAKKYPDKMQLTVAENLPFNVYVEKLKQADILLDQLYSYSPSMNTLEAMNQATICVGGGEEDFYNFIQEKNLRPVFNVQPTFESTYKVLEELVLHPENIDELKGKSQAFIRKHYDYIKVAQQYIDFYLSK